MEWVEQQIGTGDGCTTFFCSLVHHRPVAPGTLKAYLISSNALDLLVGLEGRKPIEDFGVVINEKTGQINVNFTASGSTPTSGYISLSPPPLGTAIWVRYAWRPPRLRDAKIRVKLNGRKEWVSVRELQDAFGRSDRPWPDEQRGCRGPCRH